MDIEWEAKFLNIDPKKIRQQLTSLKAKLIKPKILFKRAVFKLPKDSQVESGWLRVRDEGDKVTLSLKSTVNGKIDTQKELMIIVDSYSKATELLALLGCHQKSYQENYREMWQLDETEICIDEWPYVEPFIEIESSSEANVKKTAELLGFDYQQARFGALDQVVTEKYGIPLIAVNSEIPTITFDEPNPFQAWLDKNKSI